MGGESVRVGERGGKETVHVVGALINATMGANYYFYTTER